MQNDSESLRSFLSHHWYTDIRMKVYKRVGTSIKFGRVKVFKQLWNKLQYPADS